MKDVLAVWHPAAGEGTNLYARIWLLKEIGVG